MFDRAREFLDAVLPAVGASERIEIRAKLSQGYVVSRWAQSIDECLLMAAPLAVGADVWFGPALRISERGDAAHVARLQALWCDVDAKCFVGGKEEALVAVREVILPPSLIIDSGNGFHAYWRLAYPIHAHESGSEARSAMKGIRGALETRTARPLDRVDDLPRVLRLPGTKNRKSMPPRSVTLVESRSDVTYDLTDIRRAGLWEAADSAPAARARVTCLRPLHPLRPLARWLDGALSYPDRYVRTSLSELDFAVVCRLLEVVGPAEAESIWISSALGARQKVQGRPDYRQRTIQAALNALTVPEKSVPAARLRIEVA